MLNNNQARDNKANFSKQAVSSFLKFYPDDTKRFLQWGALGFLGLGAYQMFMTLAKRNINPCCELKDRTESLNNDPMIRDAFIHMQNYRELNPWLFKSALQNTDQLLFLEDALVSEKTVPVRKDKELAFTYFRMAVQRLNQFQMLVREELGNEQGMCVNIFVKKIYEQLQKHLLNTFHMCSRFKPENLIVRAQAEVQTALRNYRKNIPYKNPLRKWEKVKRKKHRRRKEKRNRSTSFHQYDNNNNTNNDNENHQDRGNFAREYFQKKKEKNID